MLEIVFMGLVLFAERSGGGRTVVIPTLSNGATVVTPCTPTHVEGHMAYIVAAKDDVASCDACDSISGDRMRLRLDGGELAIEGIANTKYEEDLSFRSLVPKLQSICPTFELADNVDATTLAVTTGKLYAEKMKDERSSILRVETDGAVTFIATRNGIVRKMVLKPTATKITIANRGLSAIDGRPPLAENHFLAFYKLSKEPVKCSLPLSDDQETTIACSNSQYP
jgi:hypothetical protein